jgi:hypothetical protein
LRRIDERDAVWLAIDAAAAILDAIGRIGDADRAEAVPLIADDAVQIDASGAAGGDSADHFPQNGAALAARVHTSGATADGRLSTAIFTLLQWGARHA